VPCLLTGCKSDPPSSGNGGSPVGATASCPGGSTPCSFVSEKGTPVQPKGTGKKINIYGEGETPGFEDYATEARFATGGNNVTRPLTSAQPQPPGIPDKSASDICMRSAPVSKTTIDEIRRIAQPGCRITFATTTVGYGTQAKKLLDAFPGKKIIEKCTWDTCEPVVVFEIEPDF
jgi:hypothetical protein